MERVDGGAEHHAAVAVDGELLDFTFEEIGLRRHEPEAGGSGVRRDAGRRHAGREEQTLSS
jgi:hypothetical protein